MGALDKIVGKSAEQVFIENLKRGKSEEQKRVIDFFLSEAGCFSGCMSGCLGKSNMTMTEYQQLVANRLY